MSVDQGQRTEVIVVSISDCGLSILIVISVLYSRHS
jgi:hypothetical protein